MEKIELDTIIVGIVESFGGWQPSWLNGLQGCWNTDSRVGDGAKH